MSDPFPPNDNPHDSLNDNPYAGPAVGFSRTPPTEPGPLSEREPHRPDPGSGTSRTLAWAAVAILLPIVVLLQQLQPAPTAVEPAKITAPTALDPFTTTAKPMLKMRQLLGEDADDGTMNLLSGNLSDAAVTSADRVRLAITLWELDQPDEAQKTLDELALGLEPDDAIAPDIEIVTRLLAGEQPATSDEREGFIQRHGWFAELALSHDDEVRHDELLSGGGAMIAVGAVIGLGIFTALAVGLVLLIIGLVRASSGKMPRRFTPPDPGGSVYLEMLPLFIASFLALQVLGGLFSTSLSVDDAKIASIASQWLLLGVIAWPLLRGVSWSRVRQDLGLVAPNGVLKEIGAGALFYLASLPILFVAITIMLILFFILSFFTSAPGSGGTPPSNPIIDMVSGASPLLLVMFVLLGTIWAPLMEELIFRGGVYRHLRSRLHWTLAALIVAIFFGLMHGYHPIQLIPIMTLGFVFAVIREWRGSIIACMTAHFIHNFSVFLILGVVLRFVLN